MCWILSWNKCITATEITAPELNDDIAYLSNSTWIYTDTSLTPLMLPHVTFCTFSVLNERHHHVTEQSNSLSRATARLFHQPGHALSPLGSPCPLPPPHMPKYCDFSCCCHW